MAGAVLSQLSICISADGGTIVWSPAGASTSYSIDNGKTWTRCVGGVPDSAQPKADPVNPKKFYIFDAISAGQIWASTDGGKTFSKGAGGLPTVPSYQMQDGYMTTVPGHEGDLWMCTGSGGLYHSTNSGSSASRLNSVNTAWLLGVGKPSTASGYPALYLWGIVKGTLGIFRSDDIGATWTRINDDSHQFGTLSYITGDPRVYGRCYISTGGRGILYGEPANSDTTDNPTTFSFSPVSGDSLGRWYQRITAQWSKATDPQQKPLTYIIHFFGPAVDTTFQSTESTTSFSVGTILPSSQYVLTGYVTNGFDTTASGNAIWFSAASVISGLVFPQRPTLASPADGTTNVQLSPTLSWNAVPGATLYWLQLSLSPTFLPAAVNDSTLSTTSRGVGALSLATTYYWRVKAKNAAGWGEFSTAKQFSTILTSAVEQLGGDVPKEYALNQNYPNPFNPATTIQFALPKSSPVSLRIFDLLGREVVSLISGEMAPGYFRVRWQANVPSGVYFYHLQAGDFVETKRLILLK